jgi:hypothetical protein
MKRSASNRRLNAFVAAAGFAFEALRRGQTVRDASFRLSGKVFALHPITRKAGQLAAVALQVPSLVLCQVA